MIREDFPVPASPHTATLTTPLPPAYPTLSFPGISLSLSLSLCPRVRLALRASSSSPALVAVLFAPLPASRHRFHSKKEKKNENLKISLQNLSWGSNPKVSRGAEQRLVAMEDGSRSAALASESPTTSLSSSSSKAIRLPLRGITAGTTTTTTKKQNQAKFWHGSFRVLGGAESKRYLLSLPLSLSLCLYVCLSDDDTRAFFLFANLRQREGTPSSAGVKEGRDEQLPFTGPRGGRGQIRGTTTNRFRVPPGWYTILDSLSLSLSEAPITTLRL